MEGVGSVTAIITTFRRAPTLKLAIASALRQGPCVGEVIVVDDNDDDAQADQVAAIAKSFASLKITYVRNPTNLGVAASRNIGILRATTEYVAFLDDDDYWLPAKAEGQLRLMTPAIAGVDCGFVEKDPWGIVVAVRGDGRPKSKLDMLRTYCPISASVVMVRRAVAIEAGLFDEAMSGFEDYDLWLRCAAFGMFANLSEPACVYVQHSGSRLSAAPNRLEVLDRLIDKWRGEMGGDKEALEFGRRWRAIQFATNSRRALGVDALEALRSGLAAVRELPSDRIGWVSVFKAVIGARISRSLRRLHHLDLAPSQALVDAMKEIEASFASGDRDGSMPRPGASHVGA